MIILPILTALLMHFSSKGWEKVLFEHRSGGYQNKKSHGLRQPAQQRKKKEKAGGVNDGKSEEGGGQEGGTGSFKCLSCEVTCNRFYLTVLVFV